jgi:hypothetical protein
VVAVNTTFCQFPSGLGSHFHLDFDFTDVNGDVVKPGAQVKTQCCGLSEIDLPSFTITGTGSSGHITATICIKFNGASSTTQNTVLIDAGGNRSNTLAINVPRPAGAN